MTERYSEGWASLSGAFGQTNLGHSIQFGGFSIWQEGIKVAGGSGPIDAIRRVAAHYARIYRMDGPVKVRIWKRR